ncbi:MAG: hypothetical protein JWN17_3245, partial [Frankiales bacterium]|nr:hypothetical protein [Frankiales bacterium]
MALLGPAQADAAAWEACGTAVVGPAQADVVVTDRRGLPRALDAAAAVVVLGRGPVRAPGWRSRRYLRATGPVGPSLLLLADAPTRRAVAG